MAIARRKFLGSAGMFTVGAFATSATPLLRADADSGAFHWNTGDLNFSFDIAAGRLRQKRFVPAGTDLSDNS